MKKEGKRGKEREGRGERKVSAHTRECEKKKGRRARLFFSPYARRRKIKKRQKIPYSVLTGNNRGEKKKRSSINATSLHFHLPGQGKKGRGGERSSGPFAKFEKEEVQQRSSVCPHAFSTRRRREKKREEKKIENLPHAPLAADGKEERRQATHFIQQAS